MPKPATVTDYLAQLDPALREVVDALRQTILAAHPAVEEQIKWNSPSFYYTGPMAPFDPKEYRRDIVVVNLHRGHALLVFPTGATIPDPAGLLQGTYTDGRRLLPFSGLADVVVKAEQLQTVVRAWVSQVER